MKRPTWLLISLVCAAAQAATVNMSDPRRAVGTDDGIRVDAALANEFVSPGSPIRVTYRVENRSPRAVGIAETRCDVSFDEESRTLKLSFGAEVPKGGEVPKLLIVDAGKERTFVTTATFRGRAVPQSVEIKVNVLRDVAPFLPLGEHQRLTDAQFDRWIETNDPIVLNAIPVRYEPGARAVDASQR